jgi:PQQ-dependent dehydrogenase (methanol/ethanol family)
MRTNRYAWAALGAALLAAGCGEPRARGPAAVDGARILDADAEPGQWLSYGRDYEEQHWSPLDQINRDTVADLGLAWYADIPLNQGQEATPLVIDGVIYLASAWSNVFAYDARTGALIWRYDPEVPGQQGIDVCCGVVNRGVAAWNGKIYVGTLDGRLVALDAATGQEVWSVQTTPPEERYSITGAVRAIKGRILVGNSGAEFGVRGYVSAYDAETGTLDWRFYTVPGNPALGFENDAMAMAAETWNGEWWRLGGGGTVWDAIVYDPVTDLVLIGVGNGSPWNQAIRSPGGGDNLFLASIVAVDADTGEYRWHYQTTPGETWDFTATQPIMIAELELDGAMRRVVMQAPKNGFFYVLDAATGALLSAEKFAPANWASHVDLATGRPVENPETRYDMTGEVAYVTPTGIGAHNWRPMALSHDTGLVYFATRHIAQAYVGDPDFVPSSVGANTGIDRTFDTQAAAAAAGLPEFQFEDTGGLVAWDPVGQRAVWRAVDPDGAYHGGALATAGGLVFAGGGGDQFQAYDAATGALVWSADAQTAVAAGPVAYELDGVPYIAVAAGRGLQPYYQPNYSRLLVYTLGGTAQLPPPIDWAPPVLDPPTEIPAPALVARGEDVYGQNCFQCHGNSVSTFPDLRYSGALHDQGLFDAIVLEGALSENGMASFAGALGSEDTAAVRAYVISLAQEEMARLETEAASAEPEAEPEPHGDEAEPHAGAGAAQPHD